MATIQEINEQARALKREGKYDEALSLYSKGLKALNNALEQFEETGEAQVVVEGTEPATLDFILFQLQSTYYNLAKIAYLKEDPSYAIRAYLAAMHIEVSKVASDIHTGELSEEYKKAFRQIPQEAIAQLPHPAAAYIYFERDKPRHIAHAFMDYNEDFLKSAEANPKYVAAYKAKLRGDGSYEDVLKEQGITEEESNAAELQFYWPFGARFFMKNGLDWSRIDATNVFEIYFESEERQTR
ncbi:MAG: hypothetical protein UHX00_05505 [Caryophanon sp.]|nr:hypothetical protein [Caryophanon sp.]